MSEVRHINILAALVVTALEMSIFVLGMARVTPTLSPPAIAVRLVALPAPVLPTAMPAIETQAPSASPPKPPDQAMPVIETEAPAAPQPLAAPADVQPLPAVPAAKPRPPSSHREAMRRSRQIASPIPAPATSPRTETVPTPSASPPGGGTMGARALYKPMPEIPEELRRHAMNLVAVARFRVRADGGADVELLQPTPVPRLNVALLATLKTWQFFPALANGRPVASIIDIRIPIAVR